MKNSNGPFYCTVLAVSFLACGTDVARFNLKKEPLPNDCVNPAVRNGLGTQNTGLKTIRVRARIATNESGDLAVSRTRPEYDMRILNTRFASSNLQFILVDVEPLPADEMRFQPTSLQNPLCDADLAPLQEDSIPILYVDSIAVPGGSTYGMANACGAVISSVPKTTSFGDVEGEFSDHETVPRMMGYVLGLLQTQECYDIAGYEDDPQLSGDLVADTPFDPGSTLIDVTCGGKKAPGKCSVTDENGCVVNCSVASTPDVFNLMSSYRGCRERFSAGQGIYMRCAVELHHKGAKCDNVWSDGFGKKLDQSYNGPHVADVNGDGKADAVLYEELGPPATWRVALSNGTHFENGTIWIEGFGDPKPGFQFDMLGDVNGDNKADAVIMNQAQWSIALSTGKSFESSGVWLENHDGTSVLGDVNGDGKADAVAVQGMGHWSVALSTGSSFSAPAGWIDSFGIGSDDALLGDVDGDRKSDAIAFTYDEKTFGCKVEVARSTGTSFGASETWWEQTNCPLGLKVMLADTDGDAKSDLIIYIHNSTTWYVKLSTGSTFATAKLALGALGQSTLYPDFQGYPRVTVGDVDGNNTADFVAYRNYLGLWNTSVCRPEGSAN